MTRGTLRSGHDRIELNEGRITATTNGSGKGGFVDVVAGKSLSISGANGGIISLTAPPPTADLNTLCAKLSPFFQARFGRGNTELCRAGCRNQRYAASIYPTTPVCSMYSVP